jgi:hypothetical protein
VAAPQALSFGSRASGKRAALSALIALLLSACSGSVDGPPDEDAAGAGNGTSQASGGTGSGASGGQSTGKGGSGSKSGGSGGSDGGSGNGSSSGGSSQAGNGSGNSAGVPEIPETCDPNALPSETPLRRIGRTEYLNTLRDLLEPAGLASDVTALESELEQLPPDGENQHLFSGMDRRLSQRHVDAYYGVADALAKRLTANATSLAALAGDCASDADEACVRAFVESFGARVFRRPLTSAEVDRYLELYVEGTPSSEVFFGILFTLLLSPDFLYHLEIQGEPSASQARVLALSPYEKASRLSYLFWRTLPDQELVDAAEAGDLDSDAGFEAAAERAFADPRTQATLREFWGEWLGISGFAGFIDSDQFEAFADGVSADDALFDAMADETHAFIEHFTWDSDGSYRDVLTSPLYFSTSAALAELYGVEPDATSLPAEERSGLLTRAAMVVEGNAVTNPIKRGAFILKQMLCEEIDPPSDLPAEALALPPADPTQSTRERFEAKTSPPDCRGCHAMINPLGFSLEVYDALGRFRSEERVFDDDGELLSTMDIDPAVEVDIDGSVTPVSTPLELAEAIAASEKAYECLARQYFRYALKRNEAAGDACTLTAVRDQARGDGSLRATFQNLALLPSFRERVMEEP